jgi:hypothetical protein
MSNDVVWQVLRQHNAFVVKRDGITLSGEPGNLLNKHSYKFSGLANRKLVHVAAGKDKKPHLTILKSALHTRTAHTRQLRGRHVPRRRDEGRERGRWRRRRSSGRRAVS